MNMEPKKFITILIVIVAAIVIYMETRNNPSEDESHIPEDSTKPISQPSATVTEKLPDTAPTESGSSPSFEDKIVPQDKLNIPLTDGEDIRQKELDAEAYKETNPVKKFVAPTQKGTPWENPYEMQLPKN
jgi:hypothetical protein